MNSSSEGKIFIQNPNSDKYRPFQNLRTSNHTLYLFVPFFLFSLFSTEFGETEYSDVDIVLNLGFGCFWTPASNG